MVMEMLAASDALFDFQSLLLDTLLVLVLLLLAYALLLFVLAAMVNHYHLVESLKHLYLFQEKYHQDKGSQCIGHLTNRFYYT